MEHATRALYTGALVIVAVKIGVVPVAQALLGLAPAFTQKFRFADIFLIPP